MSVPVKIVRNTSRIEKYVIKDGKRIVVPPLSTMPFNDPELASEMVAKNHPHVEIVEGVSTVYQSDYAGERVWLYNATGNPDEPDTITVKAPVKGDPGNVKEIPNPECEPKLLKWKRDLGQRIQQAKDGMEMLNLGSEWVELHPWTRRSFPRHVADWILANIHPTVITDTSNVSKAVARRAREPASFEPDHTWSFSHIRKYAEILDPSMLEKEGVYTQEDITKVASRLDKAPEQVEEDQKVLLLKRLFFRVSNPAYMPPTREEFYAYIGQEDPETLDDSAVDRIKNEARLNEAKLRDELEELRAQNAKLEENQKKKPGRPRKTEFEATT